MSDDVDLDVLAFRRASARHRPIHDVQAERRRQDEKWGEQNHRDGTGPDVCVLRGIDTMSCTPTYSESLDISETDAATLRDLARADCQARGAKHGRPDTWTAILLEEVFEALAEADPATLRTELVQVATVALQWVEAIDRRDQKVAQ